MTRRRRAGRPAVAPVAYGERLAPADEEELAEVTVARALARCGIDPTEIDLTPLGID